MGCFVFSDGAKNGESKSLSNMSSNSEFGGNEVNRSGSDLSSKETSDTSRESMGKNLFYSMSQRSSNLRVFTFQELKNASKGFSRSSKIGEGGFGCVYKGVLNCFEDPSTDVAIKQLGKRGLQGHKQWVTEVNVLGVVEHRNLVKLLGYCADDDERGIQRLLVYEYMPNGSVDDHLSSQAKAILPWSLRLRIARDAACGLTYLHEEMDFQIIFRDFKSSNILLDEKWNAKLSDFGLARLGPAEGFTHVSTAVVGTMGYAAPEYLRTGRLTCKNDLWSYGVFLYELITGRKSVDKNQPKKDQRLLDWIKPYLADPRKFEQIVDPRLGRDYPLKSIRKIAAIANRCLVRHPKSRPKMSEVLDMVNKILGESAELPMLPLPLPNSEADEASMENHGKGRTQGSKSRENDWVGRWWRRKFMKTLTLGTCKSL